LKTIKAIRPRKLELSIGGYPGPYFDVSFRNGQLLYGKSIAPGDNIELIEQPDDKAWQDFLATIQKIDIWDWESSYDNLDILDGTQWSIWITWGRYSVKSVGSNAYPDHFDKFLKAVNKLLGSQEFY
jgi:hypothetical protein